MAGVHACKLITDEGEFCLAFDSTIDQFASPPFATPQEFGVYAAKHIVVICNERAPAADWVRWGINTKDIFRVTRDSVFKCCSLLARMKCGETLTDEEYCELYEFERFLEATVAPHQDPNHDKVNRQTRKWIRDLGLQSVFDATWGLGDIQEHAHSATVYGGWCRKNKPESSATDEAPDPATSEQCNKLIGRYISELARIAQIAGPGKRTPVAIVRAFLPSFVRSK